MLKYFVIFLILVLVFYAPLRQLLRGKRGGDRQPAAPSRPPKAENMVQCTHCGVHLPEGDALKDEQGRPYCSAAHRLAGPARGG